MCMLGEKDFTAVDIALWFIATELDQIARNSEKTTLKTVHETYFNLTNLLILKINYLIGPVMFSCNLKADFLK